MTDYPKDQQDPNSDDHQDHFSHLIGRALIDDNYRRRLMTGDAAEQIAAMQEAGLTEEQATNAQPALDEAAKSIDTLHRHPVFGPVKTAAA